MKFVGFFFTSPNAAVKRYFAERTSRCWLFWFDDDGDGGDDDGYDDDRNGDRGGGKRSQWRGHSRNG